MRIIMGIKRTYRFLKKNTIKGSIKKIISFRKQYGWKTFIAGVLNKLRGRPFLCEPAVAYSQSCPDSGEASNYLDARGEEIYNRQQNELSASEQEEIIKELPYRPLISIIMPLYNSPIKWLGVAISSIKKQSYENWELCMVDDGSKDKRNIAYVKSLMKTDSRLKLFEMPKNRGISAASNKALEMASGEYIALMDQDDEIPADALFWFLKAINEHCGADLLYSDECKVGENKDEGLFDFYLKPDWSPELLLNHMYIGHLTMYKADFVRQLGGFRSKFDFSQDYDLALRASHVSANIIHVERILYFWRTLPTSGAAGGKDYARKSNLSALVDWFAYNGLPHQIIENPNANYGRITARENPLVSIIIPTDSESNLFRCITAICKSTYTNFEIIPVTNSLVAEKTKKEFVYLDSLSVCEYNKLYNFSDKCNEGARQAKGSVLVFYNDDVAPISKDWIERLLEILCLPGVGGVSPKLLYENNCIQYCGMTTGVPGMCGTIFNCVPDGRLVPNPYHQELIKDVSVLSGACLMMEKDLFDSIGGFDALNTPCGHSDVDLSLKIIDKGYRCAYTPYSVLLHIGNHTWANKAAVDKSDIFCLKRWGKYFERDRYFTDSMKELLYNDFRFKHKIYVPEGGVKNAGQNSKDVLLLSHELTRTGAPHVLKILAEIILREGGFPVVMSPVDGPLREELLDMGIIVIIDEAMVNGSWTFEHFARNFDLVVANTIACSNAVKLLSGSLPPVLWWIHEGEYAFKIFEPLLPHEVDDNIKIYPVSKYTAKYLKQYNLPYQKALAFGIPEVECIIDQTPTEKTSFLVAGSIERRKGQDVLLDAIKLLDEKGRENTCFFFVGNPLENEILEKIKEYAKENHNVKFLPAVKHDVLMKMLGQSRGVIVSSRDEPFSICAVEAFMEGKVCICSDHAGVCDFIKDGENGLIFQSENAQDLANKITYVCENPALADRMAAKGRKTYDKFFTLDSFEAQINKTLAEDFSFSW